MEEERFFRGAWQYYARERSEIGNDYDVKVEDDHAKLIARKLVQHFKIRFGKEWTKEHGLRKRRLQIIFRNQQGGHAHISEASFSLPHNPSIGYLCHELGHFKARHSNHGNRWHNADLLDTVKTFVLYAKNRNYWKEEYEARKQRIASKPQPTKKDLDTQRLTKIQEHIKQLTTKSKRIQTLLKKYHKKERYYTKKITEETLKEISSPSVSFGVFMYTVLLWSLFRGDLIQQLFSR